jgi:hypothetical protein
MFEVAEGSSHTGREFKDPRLESRETFDGAGEPESGGMAIREHFRQNDQSRVALGTYPACDLLRQSEALAAWKWIGPDGATPQGVYDNPGADSNRERGPRTGIG